MAYNFCPNCESKNVLVYEGGEDDSTCLDCAFSWKQFDNYITVSRQVLEQIAGLRNRPATSKNRPGR